jgi:tyrosine-protein kinase Etk/Wzc
MDEQISLGDLGRTLLRSRKAIIASTVGAFVISAAIALVLPQWYKAKATILPPESGLATPDIISVMRYAGVKPTQLPTVTTPSDIFAAILRSNTTAEAVIDSLGLMRAYNAGSLKDARARVFENVRVTIGPEGLVEVTYEDKDRARAAEVANAFVRELDRFNRLTRVTTARRVREMVEKRLSETRAELEGAQNLLQVFKENTGAVFITEQATASIETAAELYGQIAKLEVDLQRLRQYATDKSPEVMDLKVQMQALGGKLAEMGYADSGSQGAPESKLFPRFDAAPELEKRLADLTMDVEVKRTVYRVLSEQYEEARIEELRTSTTIQVLDWARPPDYHSKPKRKVIVSLSTLAAFLVASGMTLYRGKRRGFHD